MTPSPIGDASKRRLFAASVDNLLAMFSALLVASRVPEWPDPRRASLAVTAYLMYFFVQEGFWSNTIGKRIFGLTVRRLNGERCGLLGAFVRTATRVLEANPILLGGLPAALMGAFSKRHQRLGDFVASCVVVRTGEPSLELGAVQQGVEADEAR
jgi:uncharacterized RDD family membrane protein YckC